MNFKTIIPILLIMILIANSCKKEDDIIIEDDETNLIAEDLLFAEGPAYFNGSLYFSDIQANIIYKWNETEGLQVYKENSGGANGLYFDNEGNLIVCEGTNKRIVSIDINQNVTILADQFENKSFNEPNDLWVSPNGNIYFTDPVFSGTLSQNGEHVYCILASGNQIIKVADDLVKPNGIIGNNDGTRLYIADYGASKIYQYEILSDGTLTNKQLFTEVQADGLTIDNSGNIYAACEHIMKYSSESILLETIETEGTLTNLCFVENNNNQLLFSTTHNNVYQINL